MEFDFFNEWERVKTVKVGSTLMKKIASLPSLDNMSLIDATFPAGHADAGEQIERYVLKDSRYPFAEALSKLLIEECQTMTSNEGDSSAQNSESKTNNNSQVLVELLSLVLDDKTTHFALG